MKDNFVLLYNLLGYEKNGSKTAFARSIDRIDTAEIADSSYVLLDAAGREIQKGTFDYFGISFGLQLWKTDFSDITAEGSYTLQVKFFDGAGETVYEETSDAFQISERLYTKNMLLPITVYNARVRRAPDEYGYGYFDCNSKMGESYSHGIFLNGLIKTYVMRRDAFSAEELAELLEAAQIAFDYLYSLHDAETGEFFHSSTTRPGEDLNHGLHNTYEGLYGFTAYLYHAADIDPDRANAENFARAVKSVSFLETRLTEAMSKDPKFYQSHGFCHFEMLVPVYYYLYKISGDDKWLAKGIALVDEILADFDLRKMARVGIAGRGIPMLEGVYLFAKELAGTEKCENWIRRLTEIKDLYYKDLPAKNAWGIVPVSGLANAAEEWDHMENPPAAWQFITQHATNALDTCFLSELTGDPSLEKVAAGAIGIVMGLNAGFDASLVEGAPEGRKMTVGAFVHNLPARHAKAWYHWEFDISDSKWMSLINGFKMKDGQYFYDYVNWDDWYTGETFIKHDGAFAYAFCVYEDLVKNMK